MHHSAGLRARTHQKVTREKISVLRWHVEAFAAPKVEYYALQLSIF